MEQTKATNTHVTERIPNLHQFIPHRFCQIHPIQHTPWITISFGENCINRPRSGLCLSILVVAFGFFTNAQNGNNAIIANVVFPHICSFHLYLQHMILVNMTLHLDGCNGSTFQHCRLHWSISFLMAPLKQNWQYWHSCRKNLIDKR